MKLVFLSPSATEILYALGCSEIVGVTKYCDFPAAAKMKQKVGSLTDIDFDKVKSLKPDLIFTSTIVQEKILKKAIELRFNVVHTDPRTLEQVCDSFLQIGKSRELNKK